eukprot:jgi/Mesvir1/29069/Mv25741-RA.1
MSVVTDPSHALVLLGWGGYGWVGGWVDGGCWLGGRPGQVSASTFRITTHLDHSSPRYQEPRTHRYQKPSPCQGCLAKQ